MRRRRSRKGILALGALCVGLTLAPTGARAQLFGGPQAPPSGGAAIVGGSTGSTAGNGVGMAMYANPYMNPMMNPYMNPYMTQMSGTQQGNPALYLFAAQQMNGGIGSGRLGGPRASAGQTARPARPETDDHTRGTGANTPGATASRYFSRNTPANKAAARYYGRQSTHFPNNGR